MTRLRLILTAFVGAALLSGLCSPVAVASTSLPMECSATFFHGDKRLGPEVLPALGQVGFELAGYQRTGGQPADRFLSTYYNSATSSWIYPPDNGYVIGPNGQPLEFQLSLVQGQDIDRFGSEYGSFLAPEGLPYATRSIPPQSLVGNPAAGCNYHDYRVQRSFAVHAGPIAAWFAQPGGGLQYQLDGSLVPGAPTSMNVMWLVDNGYLARLR